MTLSRELCGLIRLEASPASPSSTKPLPRRGLRRTTATHVCHTPGQLHTVTAEADGLVFRIPPRRHVFGLVLLTLWLCLWLIVEIATPAFLLQALFHPLEFAVLVLACVGLWTAAGLWALHQWLWQVLGCEILTITPATLTLQRAIFGCGRRRTYDVAHIRQLHVPPTGALAFEHEGRLIRFGTGLPLTEARFILHTLTTHLPALASTSAAD